MCAGFSGTSELPVGTGNNTWEGGNGKINPSLFYSNFICLSRMPHILSFIPENVYTLPSFYLLQASYSDGILAVPVVRNG